MVSFPSLYHPMSKLRGTRRDEVSKGSATDCARTVGSVVEASESLVLYMEGSSLVRNYA